MMNTYEIFLLQVFGLGNKTYEHYNSMGKFVDKKLEELGATRVFELGMGDDDAKYVIPIFRYMFLVLF